MERKQQYQAPEMSSFELEMDIMQSSIQRLNPSEEGWE